jgi:hypothetical protein
MDRPPLEVADVRPSLSASRTSCFPPLGKTKTDSCNPLSPRACGVTAKLLIDECLHTSLVEVAHEAGYLADHVNYLGLGSLKDWQLMATITTHPIVYLLLVMKGSCSHN